MFNDVSLKYRQILRYAISYCIIDLFNDQI